MNYHTVPALAGSRDFAPGIGRAVADRTVARLVDVPLKEPEFREIELERNDAASLDSQVQSWCVANNLIITGYHVDKGDDLSVKLTLYVSGERRRETWDEVARRVTLGNCSLSPSDFQSEYGKMYAAVSSGALIMSGRHLQHGDETQKDRNIEVFSNCSTAITSFASYLLLLNGSGVGSSVDDAVVHVDYARDMPKVVCVIDQGHPDVISGEIRLQSRDEAERFYRGAEIVEHVVEDSREGWAKAIEVIETLTWQCRGDVVLLLDFSKVRCKGSAIKGMQNRPASGPGPMIAAIQKCARLKGSGMAPWEAKMWFDHFMAECVLVGGARRAARIVCKHWKDRSVIDFIWVKHAGLDKNGKAKPGWLWSANNSVVIDAEFRELVLEPEDLDNPDSVHAHAVFDNLTECSYLTGEPGVINGDRLHTDIRGVREALEQQASFQGSLKYQVDDHVTQEMIRDLIDSALGRPVPMIVNPCGEICLVMWGGYCVIADTVWYHAASLNDAEQACRAAVRALIRVNLMDAFYGHEVERTNRIGVGFTGIHEFALRFFGYGFRDLIDEARSQDFWNQVKRFSRAVKLEAYEYARKLGVAVPMTDTTVKPAGTTSKLFNLTEGAHLPARLEYLRWTQFRSDDPLVAEYRAKGYPVRQLRRYEGMSIVGFPTEPEIVRLAKELGLEEKLVTAEQATPEEQYQWLRLLEKYWIRGGREIEDTGNQVSYTMKFRRDQVSLEEYRKTLKDGQFSIKCCSVLPVDDAAELEAIYEYVPEQPVNREDFERIVRAIEEAASDTPTAESIDEAHVLCEGGGCPIDFEKDGI